MPRAGALGVALAILLSCGPSGREGGAPGERVLLESERMLMGTFFRIRVVTEDDAGGEKAIEAAFAEVDRVEELLSEWQETSEISEVNRSAGVRPVVVGPELYGVVERSIWASEVTGGAFDATFASCGHLWSFREPRLPGEAEIDACLPHIGYGQLKLDPERSSIFLPRAELRIGIAGIGKGYGVDRAADVLRDLGFADFIVDGGGDVRLGGRNVDDRPWVVGIAHPGKTGELFARLSVGEGAIVTSGDYQRFFDRDGVRYHHILDPATGLPARRSIAVTVVARDATDADALATGLFVIGPERGLALVEQLPDVEALMIGPDRVARTSSGFPAYEVLHALEE